MKAVYKLLKDNKGANMLVIYCVSLIMAIFLNSFLGLEDVIAKNNANTEVSINQNDTAQLVDRFADENDGFGTTEKGPNLSYEGFNDSNRYDINKEIEANNKIVEEQNNWINEQTTKPKANNTLPNYKPISEEELIAKSERRNSSTNYGYDEGYSEKPKKNKEPKEEEENDNGFNTVTAKKKGNDASESKRNGNTEEIKVKIFSASNQTLTAGSKASFILKEDLGNLKSGDAVYARVVESGNSIQLNFSGRQFGLTQDLYLYNGNEKGIVFASELSELKNELTQEGKIQGGQLVGDVVRNIPIVGNAGARLIYRAGQGSVGKRQISIEIMKGERFVLMND